MGQTPPEAGDPAHDRDPEVAEGAEDGHQVVETGRHKLGHCRCCSCTFLTSQMSVLVLKQRLDITLSRFSSRNIRLF